MIGKVYSVLALMILSLSVSVSQEIDESDYSKYLLGKENIDVWVEVLPDIWATSYSPKPLYVQYNDEFIIQTFEGLYDPFTSWYWHNDSLYVLHVDNPENISVFKRIGGWSSTSGDFNGDLIPDIATLKNTNDSTCYIYYGNNDYSTFPDDEINANEMVAIVASAGDVNNDGYDDLMMSAKWGVNEVYLYFGSESGIDVSSRTVLSNTIYGFGHQISKRPGDINNDGFDDILIGGGVIPGYFCLYYGNSDGIFLSPDHQIEYTPSQSTYALTTFIGDVNKDNFDDIAISLGYSISESINRAVVYFGSSSGLDTANNQLIELFPGERTFNNFLTVSKANDINNDGIDDLVLGDQWKDGLFEMQGELYVFYGSTGGLNSVPDITIPNPIPEYNVRFGNDIDGVGDINDDGIDDIVAGSPYANKAFIFYGSINGLSDTCFTTLTNPNHNDFGWSISACGNFFNDGRNYFLVGEEFGNSFLYVYGDLVSQVEPVTQNGESESDRLNIFPNPANDFVSVDCDQSSIKDIKIISITGITLMEAEPAKMINVENLKKGLYFIQVTTNNGELLKGKLIKE